MSPKIEEYLEELVGKGDSETIKLLFFRRAIINNLLKIRLACKDAIRLNTDGTTPITVSWLENIIVLADETAEDFNKTKSINDNKEK